MNAAKYLVAALLGAAICGCAKDEKTDTATTMKASPTPATQPAMTVSTPSAAPAVTVPDKDMTHVLTKDEAYYATSPAQARSPDGTLKAGTKVVLLMPRGSYSQVMTADGKRAYVSTASLKPVGD
jgi:hypothetical protein